MRIGDKVRVTTAPWAGELGTIESIDGASLLVRLDTSEHPDDVKELYPNEFEVIHQFIRLPVPDRRAAIEHTKALHQNE